MTRFKVDDVVRDIVNGDKWRVTKATEVGMLDIYDAVRVLSDGSDGENFLGVLLGERYILDDKPGTDELDYIEPTDAQVLAAAMAMRPILFTGYDPEQKVMPGSGTAAARNEVLSQARAGLIAALNLKEYS